jgi:histidinol phosphatase-like enzyme (inositol monophosphatase family)
MPALEESLSMRLAAAVAMTSEAGDLTLEHFRRRGLAVETKRDGTPVTVADRAAEQLLRRRVDERFPDDAILGEEFGERPGSSGFSWIFDPIDGTKSFVSGVPLYGTMVAVLHQNQPVVGVINMPALGEMVFAARGMGCTLRRSGHTDTPARCSSIKDLSEATLVYTGIETFESVGRRAVLDRLVAACRLSRGWSDCYGCVLVATGRADVWIEPVVAVWDVAAAVPIIEEAGGVYTDLQGRRDWTSGTTLASAPGLHPAALALTCP